MQLMLLKLLLPYLQRILLQQITNKINERRAQHLQDSQEKKESSKADKKCPPCPPCPPAETAPKAAPKFHNTIWYALSGILLGGALATVIYFFWKDTAESQVQSP